MIFCSKLRPMPIFWLCLDKTVNRRISRDLLFSNDPDRGCVSTATSRIFTFQQVTAFTAASSLRKMLLILTLLIKTDKIKKGA